MKPRYIQMDSEYPDHTDPEEFEYFLGTLVTKLFLAYIHYEIGDTLYQTSGAQWLSGRVFDSRPKGRGFEPHRRHCVCP